MDLKRRLFLKATLAGSTIAVAAVAGLLKPQQLLAAWPESAFTSKSVADALTAIGGKADHSASASVTITGPDGGIAQNGAIVPITISSSMENVSRIFLVVDGNSFPLTASYELPAGTLPFITARIKMGKTSNVIAICEAGGQLFSASTEVKVVAGGC
ncbi:MAG: thiosulfate oxidation carrier protein SoxY [Gammaproteobacteria bacterium]|nr:thiosulfate oxidation carrier protein SoxY [Gammaproteobacteria bacterium]